MKKITAILMSALCLSSCALIPVHKADVEQGNVYTADMEKKLHAGMTEAQVKEIMGTPVLLNTFNNNRIDYVYSFKKGNGPMSEKYITLIFKNGILKEITGNMYSQYIKL